jgi:hypothetical protein
VTVTVWLWAAGRNVRLAGRAVSARGTSPTNVRFDDPCRYVKIGDAIPSSSNRTFAGTTELLAKPPADRSRNRLKTRTWHRVVKDDAVGQRISDRLTMPVAAIAPADVQDKVGAR